jgi:NAD(P)-dependent dehydrogenase (short-subunit alcohol dehydrogenase family)
VPVDLSSVDGCSKLIAVGNVDILVNNAGIFELKDFFEIPDTDWVRFFEDNVMSGGRFSRALMPGMLERDWGRIIFIASESGLHLPKEMIRYGMTKTVQLAVARGLAELTAGTGLTVNLVLPGPTLSDGVEGFLAAVAKDASVPVDDIARTFVEEHGLSSLIQRFATVEEVANMVVYAISKEASVNNGAALRVEGVVVRSIA